MAGGQDSGGHNWDPWLSCWEKMCWVACCWGDGGGRGGCGGPGPWVLTGCWVIGGLYTTGLPSGFMKGWPVFESLPMLLLLPELSPLVRTEIPLKRLALVYSRLEVSERAVWICAAPGSWFRVLQLVLTAALMAICWSPWWIVINSKYLVPLLGATGILVLDSFVNNIILLGTQRILGKYLVFSSLVLLFSFFYRFASSVIFQTYSHLKKREQLILGKWSAGISPAPIKML